MSSMKRTEENKIRISVRNLVEFILRGGDIDSRRGAGREKEAMLEGSRLHRKIQRRMGAGYEAEVSLKHEFSMGEISLSLEGRADGIFEEDGIIYIDEIKGMYQDIHLIEGPLPVHRAQALCYGYMTALHRDLKEIGIQMTYCNLETEEIRRFREKISVGQMEEWFMGLLHEYGKWAQYLYRHRLKRKAGIEMLAFPFPYRDGQKELAVNVYKAVSRKRNLFIQAPTGIGKTMSTVFPAVKAMGEGLGDKLFYLTAKTITRTVAEEAFSILRRQKLPFTVVTLTAKEKICPLEKRECNPDACPYAKGHYDRVNDAVFSILHEEESFERETILKYAHRFQVCPFEFSLDISDWTDGVICDYNYVFDPNARLRRFFGDGIDGEYLFLIDEAHNLPDRAREMFSAVLYKEDCLEVRRLVKEKDKRLTERLTGLNKALLEMKRECDGFRLLDSVSHLANLCTGVYGELERYLEEQGARTEETVLDFFFEIRHFLGIYERTDDNYRIYMEHGADGRFFIKLLCVNPAENLKECLEKGNCSIFFSATLLPVNYYKELLTGNKEEYAVYVDSPFPAGNRLLCIGTDVSSRYKRRTEREYQKIWEYLKKIALARKGNYMVYFPSYAFLEAVREAAEGDMLPSLCLLVQEIGMTEGQKEAFLEAFEQERNGSLLGFCVMGGIFSEGIDLKEERLIGSIVVGTGLPQVCTEREILKQFYDERKEDGFAYAYRYPGMNKVQQAAGRVIRTASDRGVIALLDERFSYGEYQNLFPREWKDYKKVSLSTIQEETIKFWKGLSR